MWKFVSESSVVFIFASIWKMLPSWNRKCSWKNSWLFIFSPIDAIHCLFGSSLIKSRLLRSFNFIFLWKARQPFHWTIFQNRMDLYFTFLWLNCGTAFLLIPPITTASNQMETPLIFINNIFMENFSIENHTIQTESVRDPWECFRHCAKHCDCIAFQVSGKICELLDTDIDGAIGKRVKRPGTVLYHVQQNGMRVSLSSCRVVFE